jgi:regulatory protein
VATLSLRTYAIRLLARREYSAAELEQRLIARDASPEDIHALITDLTARGLLSDERYAQAVVRHKANRYSRRSIAGALKAQGVDASAIDSALNEAGVDDEATLRALWQRRFGAPPADDREKARQVRYLQARGFSLTSILKLLRAGGS